MEFTNEFAVPTGTEEAWSVLTDVPRIAPCLPGATVEPVDDNSYSGTVAVKVGPIKASYSGIATFRELDPEALRMSLDAQGKEKSGKGSASANVTVTLHGEGADKTRVHVHTDLQVTGKLAQFGRSAMADVGARLIAQFADNLENLIAPDDAATAQAATTTPTETSAQDRNNTTQQVTTQIATPPVAASNAASPGGTQELDAFTLVVPLLKRALPSAGAFTLGVILTWLIGRVRKTSNPTPPQPAWPQAAMPQAPIRYLDPYGTTPS